MPQLPKHPIFQHFAALNAVPRASKAEAQVIDFIAGFGESLGLVTERDAVGNVLIRKPASAGRENREVVALQAHLDMVHQKNADTEFDFGREGIRMITEGDWVRAEGTTLGADNGIGVAAMMSLLEAKDIAHGPLEALFTIDEETGMTGAKGLKVNWLRARYLLNLDTEDDTELTIGCAGGVDVSARGEYVIEPSLSALKGLRVRVSGLSGGHSGADIHKGLGNANRILVRVLLAGDAAGLRLGELEGGTLRNAIPREAQAWIALHNREDFREAVAKTLLDVQAEHARTDPNLRIEVIDAQAPHLLMPRGFAGQLLRALWACPNGIYRMSPEVLGLVQTSNNLARVQVGDGRWEALCLTRSSVDSEKQELAGVIAGLFHLVEGETTESGHYPGWAPRPDSPLLSAMRKLYRERFGTDPHVNAVHAGLECGIIGAHYPELEMVSFGPNILGAHSPDERVQVSSVEKFWGYLLAVLERI